jgi:cysteine desulfurase
MADLVTRLRAGIPDLTVAGETAPRAPHILNVLVPGAIGETVLMHLDLAGIAASGGSACSSGAVEPSHVLAAMDIPRELAVGAVRFSLGRGTSSADIARAAEVFPQAVEKVRKLTDVIGRG